MAKVNSSDASEASSDAYHSIIMESFIPNYARGGSDVKTSIENWRFPIESFSSQKQMNLNKKNMSRGVRKFYKRQNQLISIFESIHNDSMENTATEDKIESLAHKKKIQDRHSLIYSRSTLVLNLILLVAKVTASAVSSSMSIVGSALDSIVDLFSGAVIWWAVRTSRKRDPFRYPQGRTRLEPIGIVILCVVMSVASFELIIQSIYRIVGILTGKEITISMTPLSIGLMCFTIVSKLVFYLLGRKFVNPSVRAVALDNKNDVLSNSASLLFGLLGSKVSLYFDPIGAILIAIYIMCSWIFQGWKQIKILVGYTADSYFLQRIAFICLNHSESIKQLDTVRAFHFGTNYLVEVDIVLPEEMTLREAHDIGEPLQRKLESLPEVERAFVHLDYEFQHKPWLEHKIV